MLSIFTGTVGLFIGACISVVVTLGIGGLIAGIQSKKTGKGFYNGFKNYINENCHKHWVLKWQWQLLL